MRICECFRSLQGEGIMIGVPTFFVRTVGCNLKCIWCDTQYAMSGGEEKSVDEIMDLVADESSICVTGGEPMLQKDMPELLGRLADAGKTVVLETNGSVDVSDVPVSDGIIISMDIKCPSSGMSDRMLLSNLDRLSKKDQLKFVIGGREDMEFAIRFIEDRHIDAQVVFSPVGGMELRPLADEVVRRRLDVRVLPQLHKIIWGDMKSV